MLGLKPEIQIYNWPQVEQEEMNGIFEVIEDKFQ